MRLTSILSRNMISSLCLHACMVQALLPCFLQSELLEQQVRLVFVAEVVFVRRLRTFVSSHIVEDVHLAAEHFCCYSRPDGELPWRRSEMCLYPHLSVRVET